MVGQNLWEKFGPFRDPWDSVRLRTAVEHGELFFFLVMKKPVVASNEMLPDPFVSAETRHSLIKETCGDATAQKARSGTATACRGPKVEVFLRLTFCEHNVESLALHVIGLNGSGEKVSLFLEDWELARVALGCHVALDGCCCHEALGHSKESLLSHRGRAVTIKEKGCGARK